VEYRLTLRQDNADLRLTDKGFALGLVPEERYEMFCKRRRQIQDELERLKATIVPGDAATAKLLEEIGTAPVQSQTSLGDLLSRPEVSYQSLAAIDKDRVKLPKDVILVVEIELKYAGYIRKQMSQIDRTQRLETRKIPRSTDYSLIHGLSREAREKLTAVDPRSLGQAARISGVTPADIVALVAYLEAGSHKRKQDSGDADGI
jgi:tRNA uridine 5-carboxymethylaminomethyl modification enzyme